MKIYNDHPICLDVNFSLDARPSTSSIIEQMLKASVIKRNGNYEYRTLSDVDFLIHLCCHLYKEATTMEWVQSRRDLLLYKFSDINIMLSKLDSDEFYDLLLKKYYATRLKERFIMLWLLSMIKRKSHQKSIRTTILGL